MLESVGCEVYTIKRDKTTFIYTVKNYFHYFIKTNSVTQFFKFNKLIHWYKKVCMNFSDLKNIESEFDYFVAGSDQIWNPHYSFTGSDIDFLTFTNTEKQIAYAASFGVSSIPDEKKKNYKDWLSSFGNISVRETDGAKIIADMTGRKVPVVLDPVLLLSAEKWRKLAVKPRNMTDKPYVLVYSVENMSENLRRAVEYEGENVEIVYVKDDKKRNWAVGPREFIYLIDHAEKLLTDSFHGTAFSVILHTPFELFDRDGINMNSRTETLLANLGLETNKILDVNCFSESDNKLRLLKEESLNYLYEKLSQDR